ncbi:MAG: type II secretion system F family protein [Burkholderiaceae bacterium]|jgi:general secretion pathway protein F|nr:type II secretion system F family protein [Burkholderiaceae bacterium]
MTEFQYAGVAADGKPCQGAVRAASQEAARLRLIGQGITPVAIHSGQAQQAADAPAARGAGRLTRGEVLFFTREMGHLKKANMPLDRALAMLRETAVNDRVRAFVAEVEENVRGGKSLYQALLPRQADLGRRYLVLIRAGEASGALHAILKELTAQLEADDKLRNYVISSMLYPVILLVVAVLSLVILMVFVVPQFRDIFDSMGDALPYSTQLVLRISDFLRGHWIALLAALAALFLLLSHWAGTPDGRLKTHGALLDLPLLGRVVRNLQFAIYFRTLGTLLQRGVPLVDALRIGIDTLTNAALRADMEPLVAQVKAGGRLSAGFSTRYLGKSSAPQLIRVAEETGQLDETLLSLADRYEDEGRRTMGRLLTVVEPLIIIVLGIFVAFIIVSILSGVLSVNDMV